MACGLLIGLPIGLAIAAVILRAACSVCQIDPPDFGRAMGISFVAFLANFGISFVAGFLLGFMGLVGPGTTPQAIQIKSSLVGLPFQMLATAGVFSAMIPTNFTKGVLIWLAQILIWIVIAVVIGVVLFGVLLMLRPGA